ncbi:hypothetical protein [Flavobacterium sp. 3HN19-14]|uniref:hypothetical protein n=1 Tax=Flavobacterium sp. 3HN19-14 TaxID=3448133 RepID=UPI003EE0C1BF
MTNTNTIPLATAQDWAKRWRTNPVSSVKAFLIPEEDTVQLYNEPEVANVRAYMGVDPKGGAHLMLVGVNADGEDLIDEGKGWYIYDFTKPCPNTCDPSSPLYNV